MAKLITIAAGNFSAWLHDTEGSLRSGSGTADVNCGSCTACCRSSMFVHIKPEETETIARIPRRLLFPAPGWPDGHLLMGYNDQGHCPMLRGDKCTIYEHRPQTCRSYDCRVFAATGFALDERAQPDIAERVRAWRFQYDDHDSREEQRMVKSAAEFLKTNRHLFSEGDLPNNPPELAALAIRIYRFFSSNSHTLPDSAIAEAILKELAA